MAKMFLLIADVVFRRYFLRFMGQYTQCRNQRRKSAPENWRRFLQRIVRLRHSNLVLKSGTKMRRRFLDCVICMSLALVNFAAITNNVQMNVL